MLEKVIKIKSFEEGLHIVNEALESLLNSRKDEAIWDPRLSLLITQGRIWKFEHDHERLLQLWEEIASGTKQQGVRVSWVSLLVDAARARDKSTKPFRELLTHWLDEAGRYDGDWLRRSLAMLTIDLIDEKELKKKSPTLQEILKHGYYKGEATLHESRSHYLKQLGAKDLIRKVMKVWSTEAIRLIPDPSNTHKARYDEHAHWLKTFYELDTKAGDDIVEYWREVHSRRRNLWKAISQQGLRGICE